VASNQNRPLLVAQYRHRNESRVLRLRASGVRLEAGSLFTADQFGDWNLAFRFSHNDGRWTNAAGDQLDSLKLAADDVADIRVDVYDGSAPLAGSVLAGDLLFERPGLSVLGVKWQDEHGRKHKLAYLDYEKFEWRAIGGGFDGYPVGALVFSVNGHPIGRRAVTITPVIRARPSALATGEIQRQREAA
jgi:hypothetical protein